MIVSNRIFQIQMKHVFVKLGFGICFIVASSLFVVSGVTAEDREISFQVATSIAPLSGLGLVMNAQDTKTFSTVDIKPVKDGVYLAKFKIPESLISKETLASVVIFSSDGQMAFSTVQQLQSALFNLPPKCSKKDTVVLSSQNQVGVLQSLVTIRGARRDTAKAKVDQQLNSNYIERLKKLEKGFGLPANPELSAEIPPADLIERLSRILNAVRNYRSNKK
jgi:hypothetical protein